MANSEIVTPLKFECWHCKQSIEANPSMAGTEACCPTCKKSIRVPQSLESETPTDPQSESRLVILRKEKVLKAADNDFKNMIERCRSRSDKLIGVETARREVSRILEGCGSLHNPEVDDLANKWREHVKETVPSFGVLAVRKWPRKFFSVKVTSDFC